MFQWLVTKPIEGGAYETNEDMLYDLKMSYNGDHASNPGGMISLEIANGLHLLPYIVDPVVDDMDTIARFSGITDIPGKVSSMH